LSHHLIDLIEEISEVEEILEKKPWKDGGPAFIIEVLEAAKIKVFRSLEPTFVTTR
jgi:hypothetical protein